MLCLAARKRGLSDVSQEVLSLVSHATQERLRNILEKISTISLHRLEVYRVCKTAYNNLLHSQIKFFKLITNDADDWPTHFVSPLVKKKYVLTLDTLKCRFGNFLDLKE